jgi:hypothetical protein
MSITADPQPADRQGLAWRCRLCGRLHLFVEPSAPPAACRDCGGEDFSGAAPSIVAPQATLDRLSLDDDLAAPPPID